MTEETETYQRLKPKCTCWCTAHCGFGCMTDGCDCNECDCIDCQENNVQRGYN